MPTNKDKAKLAAALLASVGASQSAEAQTCTKGAGTCTWSQVNQNLGKDSFIKVSTGTWDSHLEQTTAYGFQSDTAPTVYLDFFGPPGTAYTYGSICRQAFTGTGASCSTPALAMTTSTSNVDLQLNTAGTYGSTLSQWDYLYLHVTSSYTSYVQFIGAGIIGPYASW